MIKQSGPGRRLRFLREGDCWDYRLDGSVLQDGRTLALAGSVRVTIEQREVEGRLLPAIVFAQRRRIIGVDGAERELPTPPGIFFFEQDPVTLDVRIVGDNMGPMGKERFARTPQVFYPGQWSADTAYENELDFGELGRVANALTTVGVSEVATEMGTFSAWKAPIRSESEQFGRIEGCDYWTPELGAPVRFEMATPGPDGMEMRTAAVLRSTNVALDS